MLYQIEEQIRRQAKTPHELFMLNLAVFHLLLAPAAIVLKIGILGFFVPLSASLGLIGFTYWRSRETRPDRPWFVKVHWKLASRRSRILLIAYVLSGSLLGLGLLVAAGADKHTTQDIITTVFARIAVFPVLVAVMLGFVLESGAIYQATKGEVPDFMIKMNPAPADLPSLTPTAEEPSVDPTA